MRDKSKRAQLSAKAHDADVNVISWNPKTAYLLASGSDDGSFKVWDFRAFGDRTVNNSVKRQPPVAHFKYHRAPITALTWCPTDESMLAVAGADDLLTLWDLSVEEDEEEAAKRVAAAAASGMADAGEIPPQLMFVHQGQANLKEVRFHPQMPGVVLSSAYDGFNVFKAEIF